MSNQFDGLPAVQLTTGDTRAVVLLHGAQVVSWTVAGREQLYVSPTADLGDGAAIRGGIPVCFPQFDLQGPLPKHGFARNVSWDVVSRSDEGGSSSVELALGDGAATRAIWDHGFRASITVRLRAGELDVGLSVANFDSTALDFTGALHTYLRVCDRESARLSGLGGNEYRDHKTLEYLRDEGASLPIQATARTYRNPGTTIELADRARRVAIDNRGFVNVVVWNPGSEMTLPDLPLDGWREFICVEAAQVLQPATIQAGQRWSGGQRLIVKEE